jgi:nicotinamidase/pyrazinamidase
MTSSDTGNRAFEEAGGPARGALPSDRAFERARISPDASSVLLVVDVQNSFMPGGSLPVERGDEVVPIINQLARSFRNVVLTQDWHHAEHHSFASQHAGSKPFEQIDMPYGKQVLWPDHCVQGTAGASLHKDLAIPHAQLVLRKGFRQDVDSYSAFLEADRKTSTGLTGYLLDRGLTTCYVAGLATDFCVAWTALDARRAGFRAIVVEDASRAIDLDGSLGAAWAAMDAAGVERVKATDIAVNDAGSPPARG